ncbi:CGNR zinc finger domain-containing protein [Paenibacillus agilis]|uniref:CGNR zinc finger domain-containing protein n=1 Tax=Paenibacillus agilis TaxID=3020863 RepID=A0A559J0C0_9BACL|nr:CGNR zinc finger domain-containing protein [Paenibacillus agilis]TVX93281.1 CGNR zinc finger domain-containing protein [Paenibacillus agilis]
MMEFLCIDIMNSDRVDWQNAENPRDMLEDGKWLTELLEKWELEASSPIDTGSLKKLKALRKQMYAIVSQLSNGDALEINQLIEVNKILEDMSTHVRMDYKNNEFILGYSYIGQGWSLVIWHVAKSFADMLCNYGTTRIKICDNQNCGWAFYDQSKNKSRRWCDDKVCGNIMKVRRFRSRKKEKENE